MIARRVISLVILGAFLALGILSFLGNPVLSLLFVVTAGVVLTRHAVSLCARCSNLACAFNPRSGKSGAKSSIEAGATGEAAFSDLPITATTVLPLLVTGPLAVIGAWEFSPLATVAVAAVALAAHSAFRELTCKHCGNDCVGNCNGRYREWKLEQNRDGR